MSERIIRAVIFEEMGWLVAQCLDYDIAVQAHTEDDLLYELSRQLAGRIVASRELGIEPFDGLPSAPKRFWDMYREARPTERHLPEFELGDLPPALLPTIEVREVRAA